MEKPDTCQWSNSCTKEPSIDLYEYGDTEDELWLCEGHFTQTMNGTTPPSEMDGIWVMSGGVADKLEEITDEDERSVVMENFIENLRNGDTSMDIRRKK